MESTHILVLPYPAQGHMIPLLDLTYKLATSGGLSFTVLVTPKNLPLLQPLISKCPSIQSLVLPFPNNPSIPPGIENAKDLPFEYFKAMMHALSQLHDPLLQWFQTHPSPPLAILSDIFLGWTNNLALQLGIPRIAFNPAGASYACFTHCLWRDMPKVPDGDLNSPIVYPEIPDCPTYPWWQISSVYRSYVEGDPASECVKNIMRANFGSWGVVLNSFDELDGKQLEHLRKVIGHSHVWAVGPILPMEPTMRGGSSSLSSSDVLTWLDKWAEGSVVFVCLGSQGVLTRAQMAALAAGLEKSGAPFVWCITETTKAHVGQELGVLPDGFEAKMKDKGFIIRGWAPQVMILCHQSVGAFLTYCGWNSMLEGILAGIPMLAWPMWADHFINAGIMDVLGIAIRVCESPRAIPDSALLARAILELVAGPRPKRARAKELREAAIAAVKEGGSSLRDFGRMVREIESLQRKQKDAA